MVKPQTWLAGVAVLLLALSAAAGELVVLVDDSTEMPQANIVNGQLQDGLHRDIGLELAAHLRLGVRFRVLPRKRLTAALEQGQGDVLCLSLPQWMPAPTLRWSRPFLDNQDLLLSSRLAAPRSQLGDVAGQPVGTVLGFAYPEMLQQLGSGFVRDDAHSMVDSLRKLAAGRVQHVVTNRLYLDYQLAHGLRLPPLQPALVISQYRNRCALSPRSLITRSELDRALAAMQQEGVFQRMLRHYR
ncbi:substrate-binding periplasmic protein [Aquitalea magnusonii]|uniref:Amino acid ABC transporter substrate-binding protein (PAAT family) n=1 Tax=Aquitalea magnusonii TaxID=332411 RepID=A0A318JL92_9NEIS|nr:transporter substrate-binding domain-containing protein [Aquitalea magnusonii]PXX47969.1 amino acid ABC transporter substrate-binding protein (PAAT family) [Aquitalea magnusonii]